MTFASLFADLQMFALFLLAGYLLRELLPPLQKLFLPSAVIGGVIALIGGQQVLGIWEVPASFSSYSGTLIMLVMACLVWCISVDRSRLRNYLDYLLMVNSVRFGQVFVGALTGILLRIVWTDLPQGWGTMAVSAYYNGHGTVSSYGGVFEQLTGSQDYTGMGMIMATLGLLVAVTIGMVFVNIGVRKGWSNYLNPGDSVGSYSERRLISKEKRTAIGTTRVPSGSVNALAFQFAILMALCWVGKHIVKMVGTVIPALGGLPSMMYGIVGAVIIWPIVKKLGFGDYVDRKTCNTISNFCLELLILSAVATINLTLVSKFFLPILIQMVVIVIFTALICFVLNRRLSKTDWFEKGLMLFGMATGAVPTGMALVRAADPENKSCAMEAHGVSASIATPIVFWMPAVLPALAINMPWAEVGLGFALFLFCAGTAWILFSKK